MKKIKIFSLLSTVSIAGLAGIIVITTSSCSSDDYTTHVKGHVNKTSDILNWKYSKYGQQMEGYDYTSQSGWPGLKEIEDSHDAMMVESLSRQMTAGVILNAFIESYQRYALLVYNDNLNQSNLNLEYDVSCHVDDTDNYNFIIDNASFIVKNNTERFFELKTIKSVRILGTGNPDGEKMPTGLNGAIPILDNPWGIAIGNIAEPTDQHRVGDVGENSWDIGKWTDPEDHTENNDHVWESIQVSEYTFPLSKFDLNGTKLFRGPSF